MSAQRPFSEKRKSRRKRVSSRRVKFNREPRLQKDKELKTDIGASFELLNLELSSDEIISDDNSRQSPDEDIDLLYDIHEQAAMKELTSITPSVKVVLSSEILREIELEIIPNQSSNETWKKVHKQVLQNCLPDVTKNFEQNILVLVEYPQSLCEGDGTYSIFDDVDNANRATELLSCLGTFYRRKARLAKYGINAKG